MARKKSRKSSPVGTSLSREGGPFPQLDLQQGWPRWLFLFGAVWLLLALVYPGPMFSGQVFLSADSSNSDAFSAVGEASLAQGHYPLWNPYLFAGMPTFGSLAFAKFLYPPSVVFNFLQGTLHFPPLTWLLGHLIFGGLGMAWLLSRWRLPLGAVLLGVAVWLLFPRVVAWGVHGHGSKLGAAMYLPWIVGWSLRVLDGKGWRAVGMTGLLLGMQLLRGHVQITYYTLLTVGWIGLWLTLFPVKEQFKQLAVRVRGWRLGQLALGIALGFLVGSILLLPVHDYAGISIRGQDTAGGGGVGLDYATDWSLAPVEMGTLVLPAAAGFGKATYQGLMPFTDYPNYFGVLLLVLAAAGFWFGGGRWFWVLVSMSVLALFVSFGNFGFGLYELLYNYLPFFNKFRVPSMILVLPAFALAVLAAQGTAAWTAAVTEPDTAQRRWPLVDPRVLPGLLAIAGLVFLGLGASGAIKDSYFTWLQELAARGGKQAVDILLQKAWLLHKSSLLRIGLLLATAGAALWASYSNRRIMGPVLPWVLLILVAMDLGGVNRLVIHPEKGLQAVARDSQGRGQLVTAGPMLTSPRQKDSGQRSPDGAVLAEAAGHDRIWPLGQYASANIWMQDQVRSLGGYHPAKLARFEKIRSRLFSQEPAGHLANWLGGKVVVFDQPLGDRELAYIEQFGARIEADPSQARPPFSYQNTSALPRARIMSRFRLVESLPKGDDLDAFLDAIQAGHLDYRQTVYLDRLPDPQPTGPLTEPIQPVFLEDGLDEVIIETDLPDAALLLLADMNAPGWKVEVNGQPRELLTADLVLRAVALPAGKSEVRFHYSDPAVGLGLILTLLGLVLVLTCLVLPGFLQRRQAVVEGVDEND